MQPGLHIMRTMFRSVVLRLLLTFALLLVQLGGLAHGITHTLAEQSQKQSLPHDQACELCAAYAQVGSALGSSTAPFALTTTPTEAYRHTRQDPLQRVIVAYAARAPPHSA